MILNHQIRQPTQEAVVPAKTKSIKRWMEAAIKAIHQQTLEVEEAPKILTTPRRPSVWRPTTEYLHRLHGRQSV
jgi:hypothetical protein